MNDIIISTKEINLYQDRWESRSSVRTRPRKEIDFSLSGFFFPEDKQPLLIHKLIIALGNDVKEKILLLSFYKYLHDIINLEVKLIISACHKLIYDDLPVTYSDHVKLNSYTIMIDEYYHVYIAKDMMLQLDEQFPHLKKLPYPQSDASRSIEEIQKRLDPECHSIFEILAVCIFETTLVRELVEFFNNRTVHPSIKYYVNDHMNDESRHYGYFNQLLIDTWHTMPESYKEKIGIHLADFIKLYLNVNSDRQYNEAVLNSILSNTEQSKEIVDEIYKGFDITPELPIVKNVLNVLKKSQIIDHPHVRQGFENIGWKI